MVEVVVLLVKGIPRLMFLGDDLFRRRLDQALPDLDDLLNNPGSALARQPTIRRRSRYFTAVLIGLLVAGYAAFFAGDLRTDGRRAQGMTPEDWDVVAIVFFAVFVPVVVGMSVWLRGGELSLRPEGPEFTYRKTTVSCPWQLFLAGARPAWLGDFTLVVPIERDAVPSVVQSNPDGTALRGSAVTARQCHPWKDIGAPRTDVPSRGWEFLINDDYECRPEEVIELLRHIARRVRPAPGDYSSLA